MALQGNGIPGPIINSLIVGKRNIYNHIPWPGAQLHGVLSPTVGQHSNQATKEDCGFNSWSE